ncbi:hypothetical protein GA0115233_100842 [Streptomyces sp. DI166]|nr:hypothetical protein GA0115233_100842 [Streptomyces sp. DI166]
MVRATLACMEKIDSREALLREVRKGTEVKYLHFWGHRPNPDGRITASCLSQWWPSPFTVAGVTYPTAEHWMMAEKARLFADKEAEQAVLSASHPSEAKNAGRLVKNFTEELWARERFRIVVEGSVHKFSSDDSLRSYLLTTGTRVLVEASPVDRIWGIGLSTKDPGAWNPERWKGPNLLGFALMEARERLRTQASNTGPSGA